MVSKVKINKEAAVCAVLAVVSMIHLYPLLPSFTRELPFAFIGDVNLTLAILNSNIQAMVHGDFYGIWHLPFLFPYSYSLTMGFTMLGQAILLLPVSLLGLNQVYFIYNILVVFCYLFSGYGAYLLFRELRAGKSGALVFSCVYMLLAFRITNIPHLNLLFNFPIPFSFYFLTAYFRRKRLNCLYLFSLSVLFQFLFDLSLGFYLVVALIFLLGIHLALERKISQELIWTGISLIAVFIAVAWIHRPFLDASLSLSRYGKEFAFGQYNPSFTFYTPKSYMAGLFPNRWDYRTFFMGFAPAFFFGWGFLSRARSKFQKGLSFFILFSLIFPAFFLFLLKGGVRLRIVETYFDIQISLLVAAILLYLILKGREMERGMRMAAFAYLAILFVTFEPFPRFFNIFGLLSSVMPFLARSRGIIRTMYIFPLLGLAVAAFGWKHFFSKKRPLWVIGLVFLVGAADIVRSPVVMGRLPDPGSQAKACYKMISEYPEETGILELPFLADASNVYPYFTRFHNKHTYHGRYLNYADPWELRENWRLFETDGFADLANPRLIGFLVRHRLRIVLIKRVFVEDEAVWLQTKRTVAEGTRLGLYERVERSRGAILIIFRDRMEGPKVGVDFPFYFFRGKERIVFTCKNTPPEKIGITFNDTPMAVETVSREEGRYSLHINETRLRSQSNSLVFESENPLIVENIELK